MSFRQRIPEIGFYLVLLTMLGLLGGFSWLTHHPEAEIVRRAEDWPVVGPLAKVFRSKYVPSPPEGVGTGEDDEIVVDRHLPETFVPPAGERMWLLRGSALRRRPDLDAPPFHVVDRVSSALRLERWETWYRVYLDGREGWVHLPDFDPDRDPPYGEEPDPPGPLSPRPPDPEALAAARELLGEREQVLHLGPYVTYTDLGGPGADRAETELLAKLGQLAGQVESVYAARFGRTPIGRPRSALVIYRAEVAYRLLQNRSSELAGLASSGHHGGGLMVFYLGSRRPSEVAATLVHELVHSFNRRAIGPALPPWLDEGLADELASARRTTDHHFDPTGLSGEIRQEVDHRVIDGGLGALWALVRAEKNSQRPRLDGLLRLDWDQFVRSPDITLHYDTSAFFVRYLLEAENGRRAASFRGFLEAVAEGEDPSPVNLERWLGQDLESLDASFGHWLDYRARLAELPLEAP